MVNRIVVGTAVLAGVALGAACTLGFQRAHLPVKSDEILYDSDLGPDSVDVSSYPATQQQNYAVYAEACSRCHGLARSINAPLVSRRFWEFYIVSMRGINWFAGNRPMTLPERKAILDFLDYDAQARKVARKTEFDAQTKELQRRFAPILESRIQRIQQSKEPLWLMDER